MTHRLFHITRGSFKAAATHDTVALASSPRQNRIIFGCARYLFPPGLSVIELIKLTFEFVHFRFQVAHTLFELGP